MFWPPLPPGKEAPWTVGKHDVWVTNRCGCDEGKEMKYSHGKWTPTVQSISNQIKSNLLCFSSLLTVNTRFLPVQIHYPFYEMSLLYLTLFILYIKCSIILHNKIFLLTEVPLPHPLSLHTFFIWFSNLNVVLYKNLLTFFSSIILIQLHNLIQLNLYLHKYPSNFVPFIPLVHTD